MYKRLCILLFMQVHRVQLVRKAWKYNDDVSDPSNWEGERYSEGCTGFVFPTSVGPLLTVNKISTSQLVLPNDGLVEIKDGGFVEFDSLSMENICVRVKTLKFRPWLNPNSWHSGNNSAIPHVERVPCTYDDVVFPGKAAVAVEYPQVDTFIRSVSFEDGANVIQLDDSQWQQFLASSNGREQFYWNDRYPLVTITITSRSCESKSGCLCHNHEEDELFRRVCENLDEKEEANCISPIRPIGHCTDMCGGVILIEQKENFDFNVMKNGIPSFTDVDTYFSNVKKDGKLYSQLIFKETDSNYREISSQTANDFYKTLMEDLSRYNIKSATLEVSGSFYIRRGDASKSISIIFGTLLAVVMFFCIVFLLFVGPYEIPTPNIRLPRFGNNYQPSGRTRPFEFARFENKEEGQLSLAASVVSLDRAFDNPLYGRNEPSTSTSCGTTDTDIEKKHENIPSIQSPPFEEVELQVPQKVEDVQEESDEELT